MILAKDVQFIANRSSSNFLENSSVCADKTLLQATSGSRNFINNTTFQGENGSVSMNKINNRGSNTIQNSSIELEQGSSLIFGEDQSLKK